MTFLAGRVTLFALVLCTTDCVCRAFGHTSVIIEVPVSACLIASQALFRFNPASLARILTIPLYCKVFPNEVDHIISRGLSLDCKRGRDHVALWISKVYKFQFDGLLSDFR